MGTGDEYFSSVTSYCLTGVSTSSDSTVVLQTMSDAEEPTEREITNPVEECKKQQRRYNKCVKKFARGFMEGNTQQDREECLVRFDVFRECVLDAARRMQEQHHKRRL